MFVADKLVYLELQKTGGSHVRKLLSLYTDGECASKHNVLTRELAGRYVVGSVRNPWDWYVSLWAYGVGGRGAVRTRCTRRIDFEYYNRMLPKDMGKNWLTPGQFLTSLYHDAIKPVGRWRRTYTDPNDPVLFREWIRLLLDNPRRFDIGEGYGFSPLSSSAGFLTYRYLRMFASVMFDMQLFSDPGLGTLDGIAEYDRVHNVTRGMIRMESLEQDFIRVLDEAGYPLTGEQQQSLLNKDVGKTNTSERKPVSYYYDSETIELVAERDRYIIEKHGYEPPVMS